MSEPLNGYVFISYSRRDADVLQRIVTFLRNKGIRIWLDNERLIPGTPIWEEEIEKAILGASAVIAILSPDAKGSEWVRREITLTEQHGKRIFPVLVRGTEALSITIRLITRQYVDLRENEEVGLNSLSATLLFHLEELAAQQQKEEGESSSTRTAQLRRENLEQAARFEAERAELAKRLREAQEKNQGSSTIKDPLPKVERIGAETSVANVHRDAAALAERESKQRNAPQKVNGMYLIGGFIAIAVVTAILFPKLRLQAQSATATEPKQLSSLTITLPSRTTAPSPSAPTATDTATPIPLPAVITDIQGIEMILIPSGEFTMGSDSGGNGDNRPAHKVYLDSYYIDRFEVTVAQYRGCADAGICKPPTYTAHYDDSQYYNHPVTNVDWYMASTYCQQRGAHLPTEAEWEKAARGSDGGTYPWGENISRAFTNYNNNIRDTTPVGSYEQGKSPYGVYDMAGNVWEWVSDWFDSNYYPGSQYSNPVGPTSGQEKVLRGGSLDNEDWGVSSYFRNKQVPTYSNGDIGFRCTRSP